MTSATLPAGFRHHGHHGGFVDRNGPILVADLPGGDTVMLDPGEAHLNGAGLVSGGVMTMLLDIARGIAISAHCGGPTIHCPTIQLNTNYLAPGHAGTTLIGNAVIDRVTRSVAFLQATIRSSAGVLATGSGVYKMPRLQTDTGRSIDIKGKP